MSYTVTLEQFLRIFELRGQYLMWLLGAGSSVTSGIPSASGMVSDFKRRILLSNKSATSNAISTVDSTNPSNPVEAALLSADLMPPSPTEDEYAWYFELAYPYEPDRRRYLEAAMREARPGSGYQVLAKLMQMNLCQIVWTTNFDRMLEDACASEFRNTSRLAVAALGEPDIARSVITEQRWPLLVKLHGDFHSNRLKNIKNELRSQDYHLRSMLAQTCQNYGLIACGYSGRDESVMSILSSVIETGTGFPHGLFWLTRFRSNLPSSVHDLIDSAKRKGIEAHIVEISSFDTMMDGLGNYLSLNSVHTSASTNPPNRDTTTTTHSPRSVRTFHGRLLEIENIDASLNAGEITPSIYVLHGLSGIGKTQLVRKYIEIHQSNYSRIFWVQGPGEASIRNGFASYARQLNLEDGAEENQSLSVNAFVQYLERTSNWLLVMDDVQPAEIRDYLPAITEGHIILTSISPNWLAITHQMDRLQGLPPHEAQHFLLTRTAQNDPDAAFAISSSFGGLPLALEQAAAYIEKTTISLASYCSLLDTHRSNLLSQPSVFAEYPESVYTAFGLVIELLRSSNLGSLNYLAYFSVLPSVPMTRTFLESLFEKIAVAENGLFDKLVYLDGIQSLHSLSLIELSVHSVSCHPLVRSYIRDSWDAKELHDCALFILRILTFLYPPGEGSDQWATIETMIETIVTASLDLDTQSVDDKFVEALLNNSSIYLHNRGRTIESIGLLVRAIEIAENHYETSDYRIIRSKANLASYHHTLQNFVESEALHQEVVAFFELYKPTSDEDIDLQGRVHSNLGSLYLDLDRYGEAEEQFKLATTIHGNRFGKNHHSTAIDIQNLGRLYRDQRDWTRAYAHFSESIDVLREAIGSHDYRFGSAVYARASAAFNLGRYEDCLADLAEALKIFDDVYAGTSHELLAEALCSTATVLHQTGDFLGSLSIYDRAIDICESRGRVGHNMVTIMRRERGEAATKAILPLISYTRLRWHFTVPLVGPVIFSPTFRPAVTAPSTQTDFESFYRVDKSKDRPK